MVDDKKSVETVIRKMPIKRLEVINSLKNVKKSSFNRLSSVVCTFKIMKKYQKKRIFHSTHFELKHCSFIPFSFLTNFRE